MPEATEAIRERLLEYGSDVLSTKFPSFVDGLKDVTRRIVWFSKDERDVSSFLMVMGKIVAQHVAGDSSVYGAIIRLGQPFMVDHPIIHIQGKAGSYYNPGDSGQPRYLKMCLSEFGRDLFLNGVHPKTLPMQPTKDFTAMEPRYFIPRLPTALLLGNLTVGFGFKSTIPMYDFTNICDMVMCFTEYLSKDATSLPPDKVLAKYLVPSFPVKNLIKNRDELISLYEKGLYDSTVHMEGWIEVNGSTLTLRTVPYGTDFGTVTKYLRDSMKDKKHWLWNVLSSANQYSSNEAEFAMEVKRGLNAYDVLDRLRPILKFRTNWTPIFSYMKDGKALTLTPPMLTYLWLQERSISIAGGLKYKQTELINKKMLLEAISHITKEVDTVIDIISHADSEDDASSKLLGKFPELTFKQTKLIIQQKLSTLTQATKKNIKKEISQVNDELESTTDKFHRIYEIIYNDAEVLKKKYSRPRITRFIEDAIGFIHITGYGLTHYWNNEEMYELLNSKGWSRTEKYIYECSKKQNLIYVKNNRLLNTDMCVKDISCDTIYETRSNPFISSVLLIKKNSKPIYLPNGIDNTTDFTDTKYVCTVNKEFIAVHRNGSLSMELGIILKDHKGKTDIIYALPKQCLGFIIMTMNIKEPNIIRVDRITEDILSGNKRLHLISMGETFVIYVFNPKEKIHKHWFHLPICCIRNTVIENIHINDVTKILKDGTDYIQICTTKISRNKFSHKLKKNDECRSSIFLEL